MQLFPQFSMIRDFDALSSFQNDEMIPQRTFFHKDDMIKETQDNDLEPNAHFMTTRSIKKKGSREEPSFEQNLMKEHLKSFKNVLQKYMEQAFQESADDYKLKSITDSFSQMQRDEFCDEQPLNISQLLKKEKGGLSQAQKKQFLLDLSYQQKLNQFLEFACKQTCFQISVDLVVLANIIWQTYIPKQQYGLNQKQIDDIISVNLIQQLTQDKIRSLNMFKLKNNGLTPKINDQQMIAKIKDLIKCYGVTIFLILQEYFQNPYFKIYENNNFKRNYMFKDISNDEFSEDEEGGSISLGNKKRKL